LLGIAAGLAEFILDYQPTVYGAIAALVFAIVRHHLVAETIAEGISFLGEELPLMHAHDPV
jgi:hypothetical protein